MKRTINEKDISMTVQDFETLCSYITTKKPAITPKGALGKNACFELNNQMNYSVPNAKNTFLMQKYPSITLYLTLAVETGLFVMCQSGKQKPVVTTTESYAIFQQMSVYSKYLYIFLAWMRYIDTDAIYGGILYSRWLGAYLIDSIFKQIKETDTPFTVNRKDRQYAYFNQAKEPIHIVMYECTLFLHHLRDLGMIGFNDQDMEKLDSSTTALNKLWFTELGGILSAACSTRRFSWVNELEANDIHIHNDDLEVYENDFSQNPPGSAGFLKPFKTCFPENGVDADAVNQLLFPQPGLAINDIIFEFRVSLARGCHRVIECGGGHTFEELHLAIQKAFDFDNDHLYAYYMDGKKSSRRSINSPDCNDPPYACDVLIGEARMRIKQKILYIFDFGDRWEFEVTLLSVRNSDALLLYPIITASVGESPEQYPLYDGGWD